VSAVDPADVARRLEVLRARIQAVADGRDVAVVAVTKGFGTDAVRAALGLGLDVVGENYAQELLAKAADLEDDPVPGVVPRWHFLGRLQRNKVRHLAAVVDVWESVDRAELVAEIARRAPGAAVLVQANLSGEPQKGGAPLDEVPALVAQARELGLDVRGLMGVGPAGAPEAARAGFRALVAMAEELGLPERSIGMSADLEVAVEEGATTVRVGTDLFGPRPPRPSTGGGG
jgi:pyridoxal phosphate enzyme (YggS family)